jgi:hypothetical protein
MRGYFNFQNLPTNAVVIVAQWGNFSGLSARITSAGKLRLYNDATGLQVGADSAATISTGTYYRIELSAVMNSGATTINGGVLKLDGVTVATASGLALSQSLSGSAMGWVGAPGGVNPVLYLDDCCWNDNQGADNNTFAGDGKVVLLSPLSDGVIGGWLAGGGAATNLWDAVNNKPPVGVNAGTNTSQIDNTADSTTSYNANCQSYTAAGIGASDTINVIHSQCSHASLVNTGAKSGSHGVVSNPINSVVVFTKGSTTTNWFYTGAAAGAWPTGWAWEDAISGAPTGITLSTQPVQRVIITGGTASRHAIVCAMGILVDYTPAVGGPTPETLAASAVLTPAMTIQTLRFRALNCSTILTPAISKKVGLGTWAISTVLTPLLTKAKTKPQALAATMTATPLLTRVASYPRAIAASLVGTPALTRIVKYFRTFAPAATLTPTLSRQVLGFRTFSVSSVISTVLASTKIAPRTLAQGATLTPAITVNKSFQRSLATSAVLTPILTKMKSSPKTIAAGITMTPTLTRIVLALRTFSITATITNTLAAKKQAFQAMNQNVTLTPVMSNPKIAPRTFPLGISFTPSIIAGHSVLRSIAASAVFTPTLTKTRGYQRPLSVTATLTAALSRLAIHYRSLSQGVTLTPSQTAKGVHYQTLPVSTPFSVGFVRTVLFKRTLALVAVIVPGLTKVSQGTTPVSLNLTFSISPAIQKKVSYFLNRTTTITPTLTRVVFHPRTFVVSLVAVTSLLRKLTAPRTIQTNINVQPQLSRFQKVYRAFSVNIPISINLSNSKLAQRILSATTAILPDITLSFGTLKFKDYLLSAMKSPARLLRAKHDDPKITSTDLDDPEMK